MTLNWRPVIDCRILQACCWTGPRVQQSHTALATLAVSGVQRAIKVQTADPGSASNPPFRRGKSLFSDVRLIRGAPERMSLSPYTLNHPTSLSSVSPHILSFCSILYTSSFFLTCLIQVKLQFISSGWSFKPELKHNTMFAVQT